MEPIWKLQLPVMVCMDGFLLTHAYEPVAVPPPALVEDYLKLQGRFGRLFPPEGGLAELRERAEASLEQIRRAAQENLERFGLR